LVVYAGAPPEGESLHPPLNKTEERKNNNTNTFLEGGSNALGM